MLSPAKLENLRAAAAMFAKGSGYREIAVALKVPQSTVCCWRLRQPTEWAEAELSVPVEERKRGSNAERKRQQEETVQQVRIAAELAAMGRSDAAIAKSLKTDQATIANLRRIYS